MGGDGETEANHHAAGVTLHGGVDITLATAEIDYFVKFPVYLPTLHAENAAIHVDILATGEFGMEACADFEEGGDAAFSVYLAGSGGGDAGEELEQGAFAGAVLANDAENIAFLDFEVDVLKGVDVVGRAFGGPVVGLANLEVGVFFVADACYPPAAQVVADCAGSDSAEAVELADVFETDYGLGHGYKLRVKNEKLIVVFISKNAKDAIITYVTQISQKAQMFRT